MGTYNGVSDVLLMGVILETPNVQIKKGGFANADLSNVWEIFA